MKGLTSDEKFLNALGYKSFLRFWSWPNLYRDQGDTIRGGDGKELCDLVVFFGNEVLLFSDKRIEFNKHKPLEIAWSRWSRKAVRDSAKQIEGAARWIKKFPDRIFLDKKCTQKLPFNISSSKDLVFYNIIVCHGVEEHIVKHHKEPSFVFDTAIKESDNWSSANAVPFTLGPLDEKNFFHIFNEASIELILNEFDTAFDFICYLKLREHFLDYNRVCKVQSESDFVQIFYESFDQSSNSHDVKLNNYLDGSKITIDKGGIEKIYTNPHFVLKKQADQFSYFWDGLIESFSFHILNGSTEAANWKYPHEIEPSLRKLAEPGRFHRRILAETFKEFYEKVSPGKRGTRILIDPFDTNKAFLFLLLPYYKSKFEYSEYREFRRRMLEDYCLINKFKNNDLTSIIGIAAQSRDANSELNPSFFDQGQDYIFVDLVDWTEKDQIHAKSLHDEYVADRLFSNRTFKNRQSTEFPIFTDHGPMFVSERTVKGSERNKPCVCGSGMKFKKCCGLLN